MNAPMYAQLPASDIERAKAWYRTHLGLEPAEVFEDGNAMYETGGTRFLLYQSEFAGTNQATAAGFMPDDFDGVITELRGSGVAFEEYDFGEDLRTVDGVIATPAGKAAWFKDSEGNILAVTSTG